MNPCRKQVSEIFVAELAVTYTVHITAGHGQANWSQKQATTAKVKLQYIQSTVNSWCTYFFQKLVLFLKNINACFIIRRWCKPRMLCSLIHIPYPDVCFNLNYPFDLSPEIWRVPCKIYPDFFQAGTLKKVVCHAYKSEKNQASALKKSG